MPLVSIITPLYNNERFVEETIRSVIAQSFTDWEMLITDDCSTDHSTSIVQQYADRDSRIHLIRLKNNSGAAAARNTSLRQAKGKYIAFLDSDDLWMPEKLEKQVQYMRQGQYAFTYTWYDTITEDGNPTGKTIRTPDSLTYHQYLRNTAIGCLTVMIDREQTGLFYMPDIRSSQDMALWLDILKRGLTAYCLPQSLSRYRLVGKSNSSNKWKAAKDVWKVYREIEHLNLLYSAFCFCGYALHAIVKRL